MLFFHSVFTQHRFPVQQHYIQYRRKIVGRKGMGMQSCGTNVRGARIIVIIKWQITVFFFLQEESKSFVCSNTSEAAERRKLDFSTDVRSLRWKTMQQTEHLLLKLTRNIIFYTFRKSRGFAELLACKYRVVNLLSHNSYTWYHISL